MSLQTILIVLLSTAICIQMFRFTYSYMTNPSDAALIIISIFAFSVYLANLFVGIDPNVNIIFNVNVLFIMIAMNIVCLTPPNSFSDTPYDNLSYVIHYSTGILTAVYGFYTTFSQIYHL